MSRMASASVLALLCVACEIAGIAGDSLEPNKFLIISAPTAKKVVYSVVPPGGGEATKPVALIDSGLRMPQGLALQKEKRQLFVADPDLRQVIGYKLGISGDKLLIEGDPFIALKNLPVRWVAVDASGHLYATDEENGQILKVKADTLLKGAKPIVLYDAKTNSHVSAPGGIAVDNFHVYWTNKVDGSQAEVGSLVKGFSNGVSGNVESSVTVLGRNSPKVYGVCLSASNAFYTDKSKSVYGIKKHGSAIATMASNFVEPRGCAWDGDGTVYVADHGGNSVSSFSGNMKNLAPAVTSLVVKDQEAFSLAIITAGAHARSVAGLLGLLASLWLW